VGNESTNAKVKRLGGVCLAARQKTNYYVHCAGDIHDCDSILPRPSDCSMIRCFSDMN
jgi:hypothetical protein